MPGITAKEVLCKSALNKTGIPSYEYCMNPYTGCSHGCLYCYASFMCRFSGHREKWGEFLDVKVNFPEMLKKQLNRRTPPKGRVLLGSVTDVYQPAEEEYEITRASLELLAEYDQLEVHILTKSNLIVRDIAVLKQLKGCQTGFTITTVDDNAARVFEPYAAVPSLRLEAAEQLIKAGIYVWVFVAPLLPGISDTDPALISLFQSLHKIGIEDILIDFLNPYPLAVHNLKEAYSSHFPKALPELNDYLQNQGRYRLHGENRIMEIARAIGCEPSFI